MALVSFYNPASRYQVVNYVWIAALVSFPFVLWALPSDFFDNGVSICPSKALFNVECFGCGITRAVMHMHHWEWDEAIYYNWGVLWVYPGLVAAWTYWLVLAIKRHKRFEIRKRQVI